MLSDLDVLATDTNPEEETICCECSEKAPNATPRAIRAGTESGEDDQDDGRNE